MKAKVACRFKPTAISDQHHHAQDPGITHELRYKANVKVTREYGTVQVENSDQAPIFQRSDTIVFGES